MAATICRRSSTSVGALPSCAVPSVRRIPLHTALTVADRVGVSSCAALWACEIALSRICIVLVFSPPSASDVRYIATVSGSAGNACRAANVHQVVKSDQAAR
jgi:hypothetical protein